VPSRVNAVLQQTPGNMVFFREQTFTGSRNRKTIGQQCNLWWHSLRSLVRQLMLSVDRGRSQQLIHRFCGYACGTADSIRMGATVIADMLQPSLSNCNVAHEVKQGIYRVAP